ncbi:MAG: diguanylate cyclase [Hahellaceae bacterium]|nr:diguanylate cyclase [Hahellaceae bacterium]
MKRVWRNPIVLVGLCLLLIAAALIAIGFAEVRQRTQAELDGRFADLGKREIRFQRLREGVEHSVALLQAKSLALSTRPAFTTPALPILETWVQQSQMSPAPHWLEQRSQDGHAEALKLLQPNDTPPNWKNDIGMRVALTLLDELPHHAHVVNTSTWVYFHSANQTLVISPALEGISIDRPSILKAMQSSHLEKQARQSAARSDTPFWTSVYDDVAGQGYIASYVSPLSLDGQYLGFLAMDLTVQNALQAISEKTEPNNQTLYLFNLETGLAATNPDEPRLTQIQSELPELGTQLRAQTSDRGTLKVGTDVIFWQRFSNSPLVLVLVADEARIQAGIWTSLGHSIAMLGILFLLSAVGVLFLTYRSVQREQHYLQTMEQMAFHDPLTGLMNRRAIEKRFAELRAQAIRQNMKLGVLLVDADHFKRINDQMGHGTGDEVLKAIASELANTLRETDAVGRIGGEEFLVVLMGNPNLFLGVAAERFRQKIESMKIQTTTAGEVAVTVSIGAHPLNLEQETLDVALSIADKALYRAKAQGRNRVVLSTALAPRNPRSNQSA